MIRFKTFFLSVLGSAILAFGLYHVHDYCDITEGGTLGAILLLEHWFSVSPAYSALVMNGLCYLLGIRILGKPFLAHSILCGGCFSLFYRILEGSPPAFPDLASHPLAAAVVGALFVGVGVGLCVRAGGAPSGDDALAMSLHKLLGIPIERVYLVTDLTVLALSVSYLPLPRICCSLVTVILSGQIIGLLQHNKKTAA